MSGAREAEKQSKIRQLCKRAMRNTARVQVFRPRHFTPSPTPNRKFKPQKKPLITTRLSSNLSGSGWKGHGECYVQIKKEAMRIKVKSEQFPLSSDSGVNKKKGVMSEGKSLIRSPHRSSACV